LSANHSERPEGVKRYWYRSEGDDLIANSISK